MKKTSSQHEESSTAPGAPWHETRQRWGDQAMAPLRFGVNFNPHSRIGDPRNLLEMARWIEQLGFNHINLGEHFLVPRETVDTLDPFWYDNFAMASAIGTVTTRLRAVLAVVLMPLHQPIMLAKSVADSDGSRPTSTR
jgi:alkanesulfonate monooxygenase SsuD/methylene tetrahydromethanopterin reductase-like flavin-dependent oxidoreductase (luciferase family)